MGKISTYPPASALQGPEIWLGDQSGNTVTGTTSQFKQAICPRVTIFADTTIYVSPTGNNSNNGLSPGTALQTIQAAWLLGSTWDQNGYLVTIQLADGTYADGLNSFSSQSSTNLEFAFWGASGSYDRTSTHDSGYTVLIHGNDAHPENVIIDTTNWRGSGANAFGFVFIGTAGVLVQSITFNNNFEHILCGGAGHVYWNNCNFGAATLSHIDCGNGSVIQAFGTNRITGGGYSHLNIESGSQAFLGETFNGNANIFAFVGNPGLVYFVSMHKGGSAWGDNNFGFTGTMTGSSLFMDSSCYFENWENFGLPGSAAVVQLQIGGGSVGDTVSHLHLTAGAQVDITGKFALDQGGAPIANFHELDLDSGVYYLPYTPSGSTGIMCLGIRNQQFGGGYNINVALQLSPVGSTYTIDPGNGPMQRIFNNAGDMTIAAPVNFGECKVLLIMQNGGGTVSFSGFSVGSTGAAIINTPGFNYTVSIWAWPGGSGLAGYFVDAHQ